MISVAWFRGEPGHLLDAPQATPTHSLLRIGLSTKMLRSDNAPTGTVVLLLEPSRVGTMLSYFMINLLAAGAAPVPTITVQQTVVMSDNDACQTLGKLADGMQDELPKMVDKVTRLEGVAVICSLRSYVVNKTVLTNRSEFREGWFARKQTQWNQLNCGNEAFRPLIDRGWRFAQNMTFLSGERFTLDAKCQ